MDLLQQLHDVGIGGTIAWVLDGVFSAELGLPSGFTAYGRGQNAAEIASWIRQMAPRMIRELDVTGNLELDTIQRLHDAETTGMIAWRKPDPGFAVQVFDREALLPNWAAAKTWLEQVASSMLIDEEDVRQTAYLLWEQEGRPEGRADEFWYRAWAMHRRARALIGE